MLVTFWKNVIFAIPINLLLGSAFPLHPVDIYFI